MAVIRKVPSANGLRVGAVTAGEIAFEVEERLDVRTVAYNSGIGKNNVVASSRYRIFTTPKRKDKEKKGAQSYNMLDHLSISLRREQELRPTLLALL